MKKTALSIVFQNRDFSSAVDPNHLKFAVNSYSFEAIGGCKEASITVYGGELGLEDTINWLRRPVTIYDGRGTAVWWGYVHGVQMRKDALEITPSLDSMYNRVAVTYSFVETGSQTVGMRKTTSWADDLNSQAEFGVKEFYSSAGREAAGGGAGGAGLAVWRVEPVWQPAGGSAVQRGQEKRQRDADMQRLVEDPGVEVLRQSGDKLRDDNDPDWGDRDGGRAVFDGDGCRRCERDKQQ
jgi:hypothetical protein